MKKLGIFIAVYNLIMATSTGNTLIKFHNKSPFPVNTMMTCVSFSDEQDSMIGFIAQIKFSCNANDMVFFDLENLEESCKNNSSVCIVQEVQKQILLGDKLKLAVNIMVKPSDQTYKTFIAPYYTAWHKANVLSYNSNDKATFTYIFELNTSGGCKIDIKPDSGLQSSSDQNQNNNDQGPINTEAE